MAQQPTTENGLFLKGVILSAEARAFRKKDGSGWNVKVAHEVAVQPGVVLWEEFHDPADADSQVVMKGDQVTEFPRVADFTPIMLKFTRFREYNKQLIISNAEVLG